MQATNQTIDLTPTWGEVGAIAMRLAFSKEFKALRALEPEVARAFAAAEALKVITDSLTPAQRATVAETMQREMQKQGV